MKRRKRHYRSQSQQIVLAGFLFGSVLVGIVAMVILSAGTPDRYADDSVVHQDVIVSEVLSRIDGKGAY
ncbi:MAG: hypothetical protein HRT94_00265 [Alphaproteobacteria bacterium]|nr:hypothetical protein [Alphaproteobacteria bacterium]